MFRYPALGFPGRPHCTSRYEDIKMTIHLESDASDTIFTPKSVGYIVRTSLITELISVVGYTWKKFYLFPTKEISLSPDSVF